MTLKRFSAVWPIQYTIRAHHLIDVLFQKNFTAFPKVCDVHMGVQSLKCQQTVWKENGCLAEGSGYPTSSFMPDSFNIE